MSGTKEWMDEKFVRVQTDMLIRFIHSCESSMRGELGGAAHMYVLIAFE